MGQVAHAPSRFTVSLLKEIENVLLFLPKIQMSLLSSNIINYIYIYICELCFLGEERKIYCHHREKAKKYSHDFACIAKDGMHQARLLLLRLVVTAHAYTNARARKLCTHLTGVLNHGRQPKSYFDLFHEFPHDADLTINILLFELESMADDLPDTMHLQMDNCWRENKSQFVLNFLALLVKLDIIVKVDTFIIFYDTISTEIS